MEIPAVDPALPHKMQLKHFVKVVRREVEPVVTPVDNVKTLTLLNAIKEAAKTGQLVELYALRAGRGKLPAERLGPPPTSPSSLPREQPPARGVFCYVADAFFWGGGGYFAPRLGSFAPKQSFGTGGILGSPVSQTHLKRKESHGSYRPARPRAQP